MRAAHAPERPLCTLSPRRWRPLRLELRAPPPLLLPRERGDAIRGWDEAVRSMRVGGRRVVVIRVPPALGYGAAGAGGGRIPDAATLVCFLELP
jgi:hypothetical protein